MTLEQLLRQLTAKGVRVEPCDEGLRVRGPTGSLTPELRDQLRAQRDALLAFLRAGESGLHSSPPRTAHTPRARTRLVPRASDEGREWVLELPGLQLPLRVVGGSLEGGSRPAAAISCTPTARLQRPPELGPACADGPTLVALHLAPSLLDGPQRAALLDALLELARHLGHGTPLTWIGEASGARVATAFAQHAPAFVDTLVWIRPAFAGTPGLDQLKVQLRWSGVPGPPLDTWLAALRCPAARFESADELGL